MPRNLRGGEVFADAAARAVKAAEVMVVLATEESATSTFVLEQTALAHDSRVPVISVHVNADYDALAAQIVAALKEGRGAAERPAVFTGAADAGLDLGELATLRTAAARRGDAPYDRSTSLASRRSIVDSSGPSETAMPHRPGPIGVLSAPSPPARPTSPRPIVDPSAPAASPAPIRDAPRESRGGPRPAPMVLLGSAGVVALVTGVGLLGQLGKAPGHSDLASSPATAAAPQTVAASPFPTLTPEAPTPTLTAPRSAGPGFLPLHTEGLGTLPGGAFAILGEVVYQRAGDQWVRDHDRAVISDQLVQHTLPDGRVVDEYRRGPAGSWVALPNGPDESIASPPSSNQPTVAPASDQPAVSPTPDRPLEPKGLPVVPPIATGGRPAADRIDVSAFAPRALPAGSSILLQVYVHPIGDDERVAEEARSADEETARRARTTLGLRLKRGEVIEIAVDCAGLGLNPLTQTVKWQGEAQACAFVLSAPASIGPSRHVVIVRIAARGIPVGQLAFTLGVVASDQAAGESQLHGKRAKRYDRAFISYSSNDRPQVLRLAAALDAVGIDYFHDLLNLEPGDQWKQRLYAEIDRCDLFLLCWSEDAKQSKWVVREANRALRRQRAGGEPEIKPYILYGPPVPLPPASLKSLHFNSPLAYVIAASENEIAKRSQTPS